MLKKYILEEHILGRISMMMRRKRARRTQVVERRTWEVSGGGYERFGGF